MTCSAFNVIDLRVPSANYVPLIIQLRSVRVWGCSQPVETIPIRTLRRALAIFQTVSSAWAQKTDLKACTEQERSNQTLSERLDQTNGVICPPDIDPGMKAPTPDAGKTPVIPPPGSPGGNPNVQLLSSYAGSIE